MGPHEPRLSMGTTESRRSSFQERADDVSEEEYIAKTRDALAQAEVSRRQTTDRHNQTETLAAILCLWINARHHVLYGPFIHDLCTRKTN